MTILITILLMLISSLCSAQDIIMPNGLTYGHIITNPNLFDPSLCTDGKLRSYWDGSIATYANGIDFGLHPVLPNTTYTISMPSAEIGFDTNKCIYCFNESGTYVGTDHAISTNPISPNPPTSVTWVGNYQVTFTTPASGLGYVAFMASYSVHTTADFNRIINLIQLEKGSSPTYFVPYGTTPTARRVNQVTVVKSGTYAFIRTPWSINYDLVQRMTYHTGSTTTNDIINFSGACLVPIDLFDCSIQAYWSKGIQLAYQTDDTCPLEYNGSYFGANHGPSRGIILTVASHDKTVADIGSEWVDGGSTKWYLLKILSSTSLLFISQNTGTAINWNFNTVGPSASPLTHSAGATHTSDIVYTSMTANNQILPWLKNYTYSVMLNGSTPITTDGTYYCDYVDFIESYEIPNPSSMLDYFIAGRPWAVQPGFGDTGVASQVSVSVKNRFALNGSCTVTTTLDALQNIYMNGSPVQYAGFVQALPIVPGSNKLWQYVPRVSPVGGFDFQSMVDITSGITTTYFDSSSWTDANNPPDRMVQIVKTSGGTGIFGFVLGYSQLNGLGVPATRKNNISCAGFVFSPTKKMYPHGFDGGGTNFTAGLIPALSTFTMTAYRSFWDSTALPDATVYTWYKDGDDIVVILDFHKSVTNLSVPLPIQCVGKAATVIDKSGSFTLISSVVPPEGGIFVSSSGTYGYGLIRLH